MSLPLLLFIDQAHAIQCQIGIIDVDGCRFGRDHRTESTCRYDLQVVKSGLFTHFFDNIFGLSDLPIDESRLHTEWCPGFPPCASSDT